MEREQRNMTKIIAAIRSYNEAERIEKCCQAFQFCDEIIIADGGSTDNTFKLAWDQPKTFVVSYPVKVQCKNGIYRNPDGPHLTFLWDLAREHGADWIISQDCDQRPNLYLKQQARQIMENTDKDYIMPVQIFLWKKTQYFPHMSRHGGYGDWMHGMWAHRTNTNLRVIDNMPHYYFTLDGKTMYDFKDGACEYVDPPCCYMHHGWESDEMAIKMVKYYRESGLIPGQNHPLHMSGKPEPILEWMIE
jgi:glycosyltransferase involved in cell wall biosynthesis